MTLVGGLGTVLGPVVGAFRLVGMQHYLAQLGSWVTVVQGFIFVFLRAGFPARHRKGSGPTPSYSPMPIPKLT